MPRRARELSAIEVKRLVRPGLHAVGTVAGLCLQVAESGARSWLLRTTIGPKRREIGLGPYPEISLKEARLRAGAVKEKIRSGIDPIEERRKDRRELVERSKRAVTFHDAFEQFVPGKQLTLGEGSYRKNWRNSVDKYVLPVIGSTPVSILGVEDVVAVLLPLWSDKRSTADKLRRKMSETFDFSLAKGYRDSPNPAHWNGSLAKLLPRPADGSDEGNYPAPQLKDAPRIWRAIQDRDGISKLALSFQVLSASRTGAVRYMTWDELDLDALVWTVQPLRKSSKVSKKMGPRRVPITPMMKSILDNVPRRKSSSYVFAAPRGGPLSDGSIGKVMKVCHEGDLKCGNPGFFDAQNGKVAVPHGFRSTFKNWSAERTSYEWNLSEAALWHFLGSKVERAYARTDLLERRRKMMVDWGEFLADL